MKVLLVWDQCGVEPIQLYELTGELAELAVHAHDQYVNSDCDTEAVDELCRRMFYADDGTPVELPKEAILVTRGPVGPYDDVVLSGFIP
jgi:hypothetical protein